jgi:hypothetical protein
VWDTGIEPGIFCRCELARIQSGELHALRGDIPSAEHALRESIACASRQDAAWLRQRAEAALSRVQA